MNRNFIAAAAAALALCGCAGAAKATPASALDGYLAKRGYPAAKVSACRVAAGLHSCRVVYGPGMAPERECFTWRKGVVRPRLCS
jgi:hypothetical protein